MKLRTSCLYIGIGLLALSVTTGGVEAKTRHHRHHRAVMVEKSDPVGTLPTHPFRRGHHSYPRKQSASNCVSDPRPSAWCAWWLRRHMGIPCSAFPLGQYNLARAFAHIGTAASSGCIGCIAVFSRGSGGHVGLVERWDSDGNPVILSGNFNGTVATAPHPKSRLIALRYWS